jgi:glutathione synthase/RimK-type ligase-like ATP-grasp enzyme
MSDAKKILILVNRSATNINSFHMETSAKLPPNVTIDIGNFEDITVTIEEKNISAKLNGREINDYDIVYFRRTAGGFLWLAATIAIYLDFKGKKYFDRTYSEVGPAGKKFTAFAKFLTEGLLIPATFYCSPDKIIDNVDEIVAHLGLPVVAKDFHSQRGLGVFLLKSKEDFADLVKNYAGKNFMFQKFLQKKEEYRVLVLGDKIGSYEKKTSTDPDEFRNNVSLGAVEDFMDISEVSDDVRDISIRAAKALNLQIAGVDVVLDVNDKVWLLEVNRGPGFTYNSDVSPEVDSVARFFLEELDKKNE